CWGKDVEDAYWKMENTDSYCKTIWIASQLGRPLKTITKGQAKELIELRGVLGMEDKRSDWKECELCDNADFHPGVMCETPAMNQAPEPADHEMESAVQQITDLIMERLK
ncbi:MAG: class II aldolase/adducin family protein, partial [Verrucomicrobiota bacterium]